VRLMAESLRWPHSLFEDEICYSSSFPLGFNHKPGSPIIFCGAIERMSMSRKKSFLVSISRFTSGSAGVVILFLRASYALVVDDVPISGRASGTIARR